MTAPEYVTFIVTEHRICSDVSGGFNNSVLLWIMIIQTFMKHKSCWQNVESVNGLPVYAVYTISIII